MEDTSQLKKLKESFLVKTLNSNFLSPLFLRSWKRADFLAHKGLCTLEQVNQYLEDLSTATHDDGSRTSAYKLIRQNISANEAHYVFEDIPASDSTASREGLKCGYLHVKVKPLLEFE